MRRLLVGNVVKSIAFYLILATLIGPVAAPIGSNQSGPNGTLLSSAATDEPAFSSVLQESASLQSTPGEQSLLPESEVVEQARFGAFLVKVAIVIMGFFGQGEKLPENCPEPPPPPAAAGC